MTDTLIWTPRFERAFGALDKDTKKKVLKALYFLDQNPRHPSLQAKPVQGVKDIWEARVDLSYRMTFERQGNTLILRNVDNHDDCLRSP